MLIGGRYKMDYKNFCAKRYEEIFEEKFNEFQGTSSSKNKKVKSERAAQKIAIKETLKESLELYATNTEADALWKAIYVAHLKRKVGILSWDTINEEAIEKVISAAQSWKKTSGHAFESFIFEVANPSLRQYGIKFALQTDVHQMIKEGKIHNGPDDMTWLNQRIHTDVFDLYAIITMYNADYVFGCIQSKTSIRDRVTRDREPSQQAMEAKFWSIAITLDGSFLALPKFKEMVNGGGNDYQENGWHGMYVMSDRYNIDRIYSIDKSFSRLVSHAHQASVKWFSERHKLTSAWRPQNE